MKQTLFSIALALLAFKSLAVEPQPGGVRITWSSGPHEVSYAVWQNVWPLTNWTQIGTTTGTNWTITNSVLPQYNWGITALRMSNGVILPQVDVGIAHWPPNITTPPKTVTLTPVGGYTVATGRWMRVSSDLIVHDDWLKLTPSGSNIVIEHKASPLKPKLFIDYTIPMAPPLPGGGKP